MLSFIKNIIKDRLNRESGPYVVFVLGLIIVFFGSFNQAAFAVKNNKSNIAADVLQSLKNISQNVDRPDVNNYGGPNLTIKSPPCLTKGKQKIYHFQYPWISQADSPTKNQVITVEQGTDTVAVQYNRVAGYCHYAFTPVLPLSSSRIRDGSDLKVTGTKISRVTASVIEPNKALTVGSGLSAGKELDAMDYSNNNLRFVKDGDQPYRDKFNLSGLGGLQPGNYTIQVTVTARLVNRFGEGDNSKYLCVVNATPTTQTGWKTDCKETIKTLKIKLNIPKPYDGTCKITGVPAALVSGQTFNATFTVNNTGYKDWLVKKIDGQNYFKMRPTSDVWGTGTNPILIDGVGVVGDKLPAKKSTSFTVTGKFKAPTGPVPDNFTWRVVHDGVGGGLGTIATCQSPLNSKSNKPFIRVSGSDVVSGASFSDNSSEDSQNTITYGGDNAEIQTNGLDFSNGSSSGQYGVTASGFINSLGNFYSNDFNKPEGRNNLTYANVGLEAPDSDTYGKFYGDAPLPNVDITKLINIAQSTKEVKTYDNAAFRTHVSVEDPDRGGGSVYFSAIGADSTPNEYSIPNAAFDNVQGSKVIVIHGNLTIDNNLVYTELTGTNMTLVVLGNIYVGENVTQLDGTYIAFPTNETEGVFDTCWQSKGKGQWPDNSSADGLTTTECNKQLTVNGRLIASKVLWKRTWGTIGKDSDVLVKNCVTGQVPGSISKMEQCAAEYINFSPEAYFNSPILSSKDLEVGNVPSSSTELPPIY